MKTRFPSPLAFLAAAALATSALFTLSRATAQPGATPAAAPAPPTSIAVIDLSRILEECNEGKDERARLKAADDANQGELNKLADRLKELGTRLDTMPREDPQRRAVQEEYNGLLAQAKTRKDNMERETQLAYGATMWKLYTRIDDAVKRYGAENGLDAILVYDELKPLGESDRATPRDVRAISQGRTVMFRNPRIDVTDKIVLKLNTEYAAAKSRPPAAGANPAPPASSAVKAPAPQPKGAPKKKGG